MTRRHVFRSHVDLARRRAVAPEMTSGDWDAGNVGGEGPQRLPEGAEGFQRVAARGCRVPRQRFCSSIERPEDKEKRKKKGGTREKRERAERKGECELLTISSESSTRLMKKKYKKTRNNNFSWRALRGNGIASWRNKRNLPPPLATCDCLIFNCDFGYCSIETIARNVYVDSCELIEISDFINGVNCGFLIYLITREYSRSVLYLLANVIDISLQ